MLTKHIGKCSRSESFQELEKLRILIQYSSHPPYLLSLLFPKIEIEKMLANEILGKKTPLSGIQSSLCVFTLTKTLILYLNQVKLSPETAKTES